MIEREYLTHSKISFGKGTLANLFHFVSSFFMIIIFSQVTQKANDFNTLQSFATNFVYFLAAGVFLWIGNFFAKKHRYVNQAKRDSRAVKILNSVKNGLTVDYSLYFRAFEITGNVTYERINSSITQSPEPTNTDFESSLADVLESYAPLIALGEPGERIGAGKIKTNNEHWQEDISILARDSSILFVIPSKNLGTRWEIEWVINNNCLWKTIFLMPVKTKSKLYPWKEIWSDMQLELSKLGIEFPTFNDNGLVFIFDDNGKILASKELGNPSPIRLKVVIETILEHISKDIRHKWIDRNDRFI